jgi:hypothetical protein
MFTFMNQNNGIARGQRCPKLLVLLPDTIDKHVGTWYAYLINNKRDNQPRGANINMGNTNIHKMVFPNDLRELAKKMKRVYAKAVWDLGEDLGGFGALDLMADNFPDYSLHTLRYAMRIAKISE